MYIAASKAREAEPSKTFETEALGTRHRAAGFGVCHARFWSCFGPIFIHSAHISPFGTGMHIPYAIVCFNYVT